MGFICFSVKMDSCRVAHVDMWVDIVWIALVADCQVHMESFMLRRSQLMTCYQWLDQDDLFPSCLTAEECTPYSHLTEVWSIFVIMFTSLKMLTAQFYCLKDCLSIFSQCVKISHTDLHITCSGKDGSVTSRMTLPTSHMLLSSQWLWAI